MSPIGKLIRRLRVDRGWNQAYLAELAGFPTHTAISKRERGEIMPNGPELRRIAEAFGISYADFESMIETAENEYRAESKGIPLVGVVPGGSINKCWTNHKYSMHSDTYIDRGTITDMSAFAVTVVGDSMVPLVPEGSVLVCVGIPPDADELPFKDGSLVIASFTEDAPVPGVTFGIWTIRPDHYMIRKANSAKYDPIYVDLNSDPPMVDNMAKVVEVRMKSELLEK